ncbi:helix-turn-helix transcriptional regulator [Bacillus sp. BHET2]|uniref:helix-turn-helix domain-containing protein n=1 Tax=Bacillus sp. BHET2 TaxID=2583818 RepID=UPI00110DCBE1|nr:helix-turn-helix transcriptional regulator [Bacillus sp. BHET2]TMU83784.1 helix-turn-helix transcriptional regulator [Bacillus sp. BHET2]
MVNLGERVKFLRRCFSMNQNTFSEHIKISQAALSDIEKGKTNPSVITIQKISEEFGVSTDWIIKGDKMISEEYMENDKPKVMFRYFTKQLAEVHRYIHENFNIPKPQVDNLIHSYLTDLYLTNLSDEERVLKENIDLLNPKEKSEILFILNGLVTNKLYSRNSKDWEEPSS